MFRLASLLVLALASRARADVPPLVPHATTSIAIATSDATHAWVAYPLNYSHGVPMEAYAQMTPGAPLDPGRSALAIYAFPAASVVDVAPGMRGLLGAPRGFGQADVAFGDHTLTGFFEAAGVPRATLVSPPDDTALAALHVTSLLDTYAAAVEGTRLTLHLTQTEYTFADGHSQRVAASADGARTLPSSTSGWGCSVGARSSGVMLSVGLVLALIARRRAH